MKKKRHLLSFGEDEQHLFMWHSDQKKIEDEACPGPFYILHLCYVLKKQYTCTCKV